MIHKKSILGVFLAAVLLTTVTAFIPTWGLAAPAVEEDAQPQQEEQLLQNPGFEGITCRPGSKPPECLDNWTHDVHIKDGGIRDNIFTPQGWVTWWRSGGNYGQPEVVVIPASNPNFGPEAELPRIRSGHYAIKYFNYYRLQDGGLYQCISGLQPGAGIKFSIYAHGWSCDGDDPMGYTCGDPFNQLFQVGIEPNGNADPFAPSIVWSGDQRAPDHYKLIGPVEAQVGESGNVCVFARAKTKWMYKYQDAYWDDASLTYTSPPAEPTSPPPPPPAKPTAGPSPTPFPTPTPRPDGAVVHVVQSGETLYSISSKYGVPLEQIRQLNASSLGGGNIIRPGQALVIAIPDTAPTATAPPTPQTVAEETGGDEGDTGGTTSQGDATAICVLSYHDRDENGSRGDPSIEELLPEAHIILVNADGQPINQYITDSVNEPHCFEGLAPGSYRVIQESPAGYTASGESQQVVSVSSGASVDVPFGNVRGEGGVVENNPDAADSEMTSDENPGWMQAAFSTLFKVGGVLLLLACVGAGVLYFLNQRRLAM